MGHFRFTTKFSIKSLQLKFNHQHKFHHHQDRHCQDDQDQHDQHHQDQDDHGCDWEHEPFEE